MEKYICSICGHVYDAEEGDTYNEIEPGTPFDELPDEWVCPVCGASKDNFQFDDEDVEEDDFDDEDFDDEDVYEDEDEDTDDKF